MQRNTIAFRHSIRGRMLLLLILPTVLIVAVTLLYFAVSSLDQAKLLARDHLEQSANTVAANIERGNADAVRTSMLMALAQQQGGLFGNREESNQLARSVLEASPDLIGAYFGYEPNADQSDAAYLETMGEEMRETVSADGRFIPYWFRDFSDNETLLVEPLVNMETSLYYNGVHELFIENGAPTAMVTEPYVYEGRMIVGQTFPILIDGEFAGIAGVDRALADIETFLFEIKEKEQVDVFLISRRGRFIASTLGNIDLKTQLVSETPYAALLGSFYNSGGVAKMVVVDDPVDQETYYFEPEPVPMGEWLVVVRRSEATILAPIYRGFAAMFVLAFMGLAMITVIALKFANVASRRINRAMKAVENLAHGDLMIGGVAETKAQDEIGAMYRSFGKLIESSRQIDQICSKIAQGDFGGQLAMRGPKDTLSKSINIMSQKRQLAEAELIKHAEILKQTQTELVESEKMSSLGNLVSGVAHEVNTPLGVSVTLASHINVETLSVLGLLEKGSLSRGDLEAYMSDISESCELLQSNLDRAASLISSFKNVAVDQSSEEKRDIVVSEYLEEILNSLKPKLKHTKISVHIEQNQNERSVETYPGAIAQIFTNLVMNSIVHGFDNGRKDGAVNVDVARESDTTVITYRDNGTGMAKETREKIFDPFFTTRRGRGGSGLGMHIVYNLVAHQLGGKITCHSEVGEGVVFVMRLPITVEKQGSLTAKAS